MVLLVFIVIITNANKESSDYITKELIKCYREAILYTQVFYGNDKKSHNWGQKDEV